MAQMELLESDLIPHASVAEASSRPSRNSVTPEHPPENDMEDTLDAPLLAELHTDKSDNAFKTISEAAQMLAVPQHVLRFWETCFPQIKPLKLKGGRRYYRPQDIEVLATIKDLLYNQGYTIRGAKKAFQTSRRHQKSERAQGMLLPANLPAKKPSFAFPEEALNRSMTQPVSDEKRAELSRLKEELLSLKGELGRGHALICNVIL